MTRKRFIKLMMSHGFSRNEAADMALEVKGYGTYEFMYGVVLAWPGVMRKILVGFECVSDIMASALLSFSQCVRRLRGGFDG